MRTWRERAWVGAAWVVAAAWVTGLVGCAAPGASGDGGGGGEAEPAPIAFVHASFESSLAPGISDERAFRAPGPRGAATIFSPLDLPPPTSERLASGAPGPGYWQQRVDYSIDAALDETARRVSGRATVTYHNNSPHPLSYLWLHLEQNAYRADSLASSAIGPRAGLGGVTDVPTAGCEVEFVRTPGGEALPLHVYDTVARLDLPGPLAPGGGVFVFEIAWAFDVPRNGSDRMGWEACEQGDVFEIAQWFPAVAVYDDAHGWNTLPYLTVGEFYTNFGSYDVRLTVPRGHVVAATGELQNADEVLTAAQGERLARARASRETVTIITPEEVGAPESRPAGEGPLTWRFRADGVRTFAWASSPAFIWDAASTGRTLCQSVYPKEALPRWTEATDMLRFSIEHYNERWFEYPYPVAINVNGPIGGMEYPMIVFCAERHDQRGLYGVTTHEIGHNWFPMVVSTDERRHAWMDEGFNSFINIYSVRARFGGEGIEEGDNAAGITATMTEGMQQPIETVPDFNWPGRLGFLQYGKPAYGLFLLREYVLGGERFDAAFREYIRRWAFKSPRPADFFRSMEDAAGADLAWFWRGWFLETGTLDQAVEEVAQPEGGAAVVSLRNRGGLVMPVEMRVTFADGSTRDLKLPVEVWAASDQWGVEVVGGCGVVTRVEVDPRGLLPDTDRANNTWARAGP